MLDLFKPEQLIADIPAYDTSQVRGAAKNQYHGIGIFAAQGPQNGKIYGYNSRKAFADKKHNGHGPIGHMAENIFLDGIKIYHIGSDEKNDGGKKCEEKDEAQHIFP